MNSKSCAFVADGTTLTWTRLCALRSTALAISVVLALALLAACAPSAPAVRPTAPPASAASSTPATSRAVSTAASPAPTSVVALDSPSGVPHNAEGLIGIWQWQSTKPASATAVVVNDPTRYTITFAPDGTVQVQADCNQVGGAYTLSGSMLTITLGAATLVACPPDSQDDDFLGGLQQVTGFTVVGSNLELRLSGGGRMVFAPATQPELVGPLWKLTAYNNGRGGLVSILEGTQPTAVFEPSLVTGSGGCNTYSAPISSTPKTLAIGPVAATRMACEAAVMDQETAYFAALGRTSTYSIENGRLVLVDSGGARQAEYNL